MAQHRYRQRKIKREHTIIEGLLPLLEKIAEIDAVQSITPGRINQRSRPGLPGLFLQYQTETGLKLSGRSATAVQEVFLVTDDPDGVVETLTEQGLIAREKTTSLRSRNRRRSKPSQAAKSTQETRKAEGPEKHEHSESATPQSAPRTTRSKPPAKRSNSRSNSTVARSEPPAERYISPAASSKSPGARSTSPTVRSDLRSEPPTEPPNAQPQPQTAQPKPPATPDDPYKKVEPELWNELLRLHQQLLDLERRLDGR